MEDFVPFALAKKLKEKGYPNITSHQYNEQGQICVSIVGEEYPYPCPEIHQVLKWLREENGFHIEFVGKASGYLFIVSDIPSKGGTDRYCSDYSGPNDGGTWDSYEEAALAGIGYVLDNLI